MGFTLAHHEWPLRPRELGGWPSIHPQERACVPGLGWHWPWLGAEIEGQAVSLSTALGEGTISCGSLSPAGNKHVGPSLHLPVSSDPVVKAGARKIGFYSPGSSPGQV